MSPTGPTSHPSSKQRVPLNAIDSEYNSAPAPSVYELVVEPQFFPFEFNFGHLFHRQGGWNPCYDTMRVHAATWHPGALENTEMFLRHFDPLSQTVVTMSVRGTQVRVLSNVAEECRNFFEHMMINSSNRTWDDFVVLRNGRTFPGSAQAHLDQDAMRPAIRKPPMLEPTPSSIEPCSAS